MTKSVKLNSFVVINGIKITHSNKINRNSEGPCTKYAGKWILDIGCSHWKKKSNKKRYWRENLARSLLYTHCGRL